MKAVAYASVHLICDDLSIDTSYHLAVKTGEMAMAGTDANVYFQLIGDEGETEKIQLRQGGKAEKRFEKGRVDKFIVETVDVGKVQFIFSPSFFNSFKRSISDFPL